MDDHDPADASGPDDRYGADDEPLRATPRGGSFDLDELARRASRVVTAICRRANSVALRAFVICAAVSITSFALGLAAFSDGMRTVWIVIGGAFAAIAVGAPLLAAWRVWSVRRHADDLIAELRRLVERGDDERRVVIETVEIDTDAPRSTSTAISTHHLFTMQEMAGGSGAGFPQLNAATRALTTFPLLILSATLVTIVFAGLGLIFLIALAL